MSNLTVRANASGTGTVILESPNTNTNQTVTLPDATTTLVGTDATQTLTNKTIQGSTLQGGALTLMTAVASTSGTAIDFTGIPPWVKRVTVIFSGVSVSGTDLLLVQGGSGSFETSGYSSSAGNRGNEQVAITAGFLVNYNAGPSAAWTWSGAVTLNLIAANTWIMTSVMTAPGASGPSFAAGVKSFSGVLDRVRITPSGANTFDAGSINVLYEG